MPNSQIEVQFHMANIKSQKKRNRQNEKARQRNKTLMSDLKTSVKKVEAAAAAGEPTDTLFQIAHGVEKLVSHLPFCHRAGALE